MGGNDGRTKSWLALYCRRLESLAAVRLWWIANAEALRNSAPFAAREWSVNWTRAALVLRLCFDPILWCSRREESERDNKSGNGDALESSLTLSFWSPCEWLIGLLAGLAFKYGPRRIYRSPPGHRHSRPPAHPSAIAPPSTASAEPGAPSWSPMLAPSLALLDPQSCT